MSAGRLLSSLAASLAVAGCAVVAIGMSRASGRPDSAKDHTPSAAATTTARPAYLPRTSSSAAPSAAPTSSRPATHAAARPSAHPASTTPAHTTAPVTTPVAHPRSATHAVTRATHASPPPKAKPRPTVHVSHGQSLPLHYGTGSATRVITVTASSHGRTTAKLQAWNKASGGGWKKYGSSVTAHVGADGLGGASESRSATPTGTFTLTQAFGHNSDPGTSLPYLHTKSSDWWISQPGRLYNTHQRCSSGCSFNRGDPNEHLYYETPYYNYAVVIDYNTRNAPGGVKAGKGSAFFLHVTDGAATAGCVAIPQSKLTSIMRWLTPSAHPRILIGVT